MRIGRARARLVAALALAFEACAAPAQAPQDVRAEPITSTLVLAPTLEELKNQTYSGIDDRLGAVTLHDGRWAGEPFTAGAASRPVVELAGDFRIAGDLDADGVEEAIVVLIYRPGGTAALSFLATVLRERGTLRNVATSLGDRVEIRSARIDGRRLIVSAVRAAANDAACCPGDLVEWQWTLLDRRLHAASVVRTGRLSLSTLTQTVWVLRAWDLTDPRETEPVVTLAYADGRFTGSSGCNRYFAAINDGVMPGDVSVGQVGGTRMACPQPQSSVEARFLEQLGGARRFAFLLGRLAITYAKGDGSVGTMLFDAHVNAESTPRP